MPVLNISMSALALLTTSTHLMEVYAYVRSFECWDTESKINRSLMLWHKTSDEWYFVKMLALRDVLSSVFSAIGSYLGCDIAIGAVAQYPMKYTMCQILQTICDIT